jgi:hypothetical protein
MECAADGPFEPRRLRQIAKRGGRWEPREEFGKGGAVFVEIGAVRRLVIDEDAGSSLEELGSNEPKDRGIG